MKYTLELTQQQVMLIIAALGEVPIKHGRDTFETVNAQILAQDRANAVQLAAVTSTEEKAA